MSDGFALPREGFRAPRVPFDLRCVILAAVGFLVVSGVDSILGWIWDIGSPVGAMFRQMAAQLDPIPFLGAAFTKATFALWNFESATMAWWQTLITAFCFIAVWSLFGSALLRTAALRLTRDEPLSLRESLSFGVRNWVPFVLAPLLVLLFAGFFTLANMAAGFVMSLHGLGSSILALVLFPLALIAGLLVVVSLAGGLIGLPLIWAGIAVEQNGALEAVSRAFSYIFARPFRYFFGYFLVFVLMSVIVILAGYFEDTVKHTVKAGVVRSDLDNVISRSHEAYLVDSPYAQTDRAQREAAGIRDLRNWREARWYDVPGFFWMWLLLNLFTLGFHGFALYVFLGGTVSLYLQLRRDVDGTDEEEIYPESEEELTEATGEPRWVGETQAGEPAPGEGNAPPETGETETEKPD